MENTILYLLDILAIISIIFFFKRSTEPLENRFEPDVVGFIGYLLLIMSIILLLLYFCEAISNSIHIIIIFISSVLHFILASKYGVKTVILNEDDWAK